MENLVFYKRTPIFTQETVPQTLLNRHNTKVGTWGNIKVLKGQLKFEAMTEDDQVLSETIIEPNKSIPMVEPQAWHRVSLLTEDTSFFVEFYCKPEDYFAKKYQYSPAHSEVIEALETVSPGYALDLGCGAGRNALYLAHQGFDVVAVDQSSQGLQMLQSVALEEDLDIQIGTYDINEAALRGHYDFIVSTVVFMFLDRERIPAIIQNMQEQTNVGGYHLIVAAMDTEDAPCVMPFSFTFKEGELAAYYKDWEVIKYNENFGHLHKRDEHGNRIRMRFATLLARKK
ncbi:SAM-dependent methyltransferase TehB [Streptococcus sp. DD13]|uniref:SAM-dependent methyltransferase TehB n=1 Tax=Streptococcus sp. DD13 TaxID=1777881 RepID=UPI0007952FC5|nr:SAM-dependent methyltransferase TehB [Streptococcus sp. DD13]KXT78352.1 Tellurite resistance protein TehB [Streptococcus sp. DD13]